jgi:hypothetical protein
MDDNLYSVPPGTFELLAQCVNTLCEFPEIELAEVANRDGYAPGCAATVYSSKNEHRIEIDGSTGGREFEHDASGRLGGSPRSSAPTALNTYKGTTGLSPGFLTPRNTSHWSEPP